MRLDIIGTVTYTNNLDKLEDNRMIALLVIKELLKLLLHISSIHEVRKVFHKLDYWFLHEHFLAQDSHSILCDGTILFAGVYAPFLF